MKTEYHEKVAIMLEAGKCWPRADLHKWLLRERYKSEDDFYYLKRKGRSKSWQVDSLLCLTVFSRGMAIYETMEDIQEGVSTVWDCLEVEYLMASMPRDQIEYLVDEVTKISNEFTLSLRFQSREVSREQLVTQLNLIADSLERVGGAGSKALAILISQEY